jgi:hypothetical protein
MNKKSTNITGMHVTETVKLLRLLVFYQYFSLGKMSLTLRGGLVPTSIDPLNLTHHTIQENYSVIHRIQI